MRGLLLSALPLLAAGSPVVVDTIHNDAAPITTSMNGKEVPDSYMIVFKEHVCDKKASAHHSWVRDIHTDMTKQKLELRKRSQSPMQETIYEGLKHEYNIPGGLRGYSGHFHQDTVEHIRRHPDVEYIEKDSEVHIMPAVLDDAYLASMKSDSPDLEKNAPWGLARISHRDSLGFGTFNKYLYSDTAGEGVDAYVIDTGTNIDHVDFEGRASWGKTIPVGDEDADGNGHGTHCSGTIAGKKFGVAKKANVYAVKVLKSNGSGTMSDVVKGVEWAANAHVESLKAAKKGKKKGFKGSVANMSLGGGKSTTLDLAVNAAVTAGLHFAVAAGNDNADSCNYSPAAAANAVTVGASTLADERAYFSNYGKCNDIFAPGLNILSTWVGSKYATNIISGTSMASPHVCGLLAYMLSLQPANDSAYAVAEITPKELKANIMGVATRNALTDVPSDTANILAWNGAGESNFSKIIEDGGYTVKRFNPSSFLQDRIAELQSELQEVAEELEELVHNPTILEAEF